MTGWTWAWLIWLLLFVLIEAAALLNKQPGDTFSEHVWSWCSVKTKGEGWKWRRLILLVFLAWLFAHMVSGGSF